MILVFRNIENNLEELDVSCNNFSGGIHWDFLSRIKKLNMSSCAFDGMVLSYTLMSGTLDNTLEELDLSFNSFLDKLNPEALARLTSLKKLKLTGSGVNAQLANAILQSENLQGTLKELVLDENWLLDDINFELLEKFVQLEVLSLSGCGIASRSLDTILRCKRMQTNLKELRIAHNDFSGSTSLSLFNEFESLRILDMSKCNLRYALMDVILGCEGLGETIRELLLGENDFSGKLDLESLYNFFVLVRLNIEDCRLNPGSQVILSRFKKIHSKVTVSS